MSDLRTKVDGLPLWHQEDGCLGGHDYKGTLDRAAVLALIPEGAVLVTEEELAGAILAARSTTAEWKGNARATEPTRWDRLMAKRALRRLRETP